MAEEEKPAAPETRPAATPDELRPRPKIPRTPPGVSSEEFHRSSAYTAAVNAASQVSAPAEAKAAGEGGAGVEEGQQSESVAEDALDKSPVKVVQREALEEAGRAALLSSEAPDASDVFATRSRIARTPGLGERARGGRPFAELHDTGTALRASGRVITDMSSRPPRQPRR